MIDLDAIRARWGNRLAWVSAQAPPGTHLGLAEFESLCDTLDVRDLIAEVERLREALTEVCDACGPYLTDAAPGETLSGKWAMVFERLSMAVHDARRALGQ